MAGNIVAINTEMSYKDEVLNIKNLDKFKNNLSNNLIPFYANVIGQANHITPDLIVEACNKLGWVDYLIANCHNLVLTEEEFQHIIDTTLKIEELQNSITTVIGEEKLSLMKQVTEEKTEEWFEVNSEEITKIITSDWIEETTVDTKQNGG